MAKELPIDLRIVEILARATLKSLIDGIVELVTNSDDSCRRLLRKTESFAKARFRFMYAERKEAFVKG